MESLQTIYKCALIVSTIGMTLYCIQKYRLDHSVSLVDFKWFQTSKLDIYPSLAICFLDPIGLDIMSNILSSSFSEQVFVNLIMIFNDYEKG